MLTAPRCRRPPRAAAAARAPRAPRCCRRSPSGTRHSPALRPPAMGHADGLRTTAGGEAWNQDAQAHGTCMPNQTPVHGAWEQHTIQCMKHCRSWRHGRCMEVWHMGRGMDGQVVVSDDV